MHNSSIDGELDFMRGSTTKALPPGRPSIPARGMQFVREHWKAIGLVALGVVAWRSKRLRPLVKTAATAYLVPTARSLLTRASRST